MPRPEAADPLFVSLQQALAGRYSLERELGRGGMGIVYLAREVRLDRLVAIKVLPPDVANDVETRERFLAEARTSARLAHPHIVSIHAVDVVDGHVFFVMGFVDGESLAHRVAMRGPLSPSEGARLLREVAWALAHAHAQGIVHRDIKPDNILIERDSGRAVVLDFGIAAAIGPSRDGVIGTPLFMSPEQVLGASLDAGTDLYALGATAFFAFSGQPPFDGDDLAVLGMHLTTDAPSLASMGRPLPRYLVQLVAQCLAKARGDRPRDAQQVADLLEKGMAARRELPAILRAFVKRDGRVDGMGAVGVMAGASVATLPFMGALGLGGSLALSYGLMLLTAGGFLVRGAHRLLRAGYTSADLAAAFDAEIESLREEQRLRHRPWLARMERGAAAAFRGSLGAGLVIAVASLLDAEGVGANGDFAIGWLALALLQCAGLLWAMARLAQRDDTLFWRALWTGRTGQGALALARRLGGAAGAPAAMTHRATELSLSLAAEQLFEALPTEARRGLSTLPRVLQQLHESASALRDRARRLDEVLVTSMRNERVETVRAERELVAERLEATVGALERLRLDLLRLHAGVSTVEGVTSNLLAAEEINRQIGRQLEAQHDVDDLFGEVNVAAIASATTEVRLPEKEHA